MRLLIHTLYINATVNTHPVYKCDMATVAGVCPSLSHQYYGPLSYWSSTCARQNSSLRQCFIYNPTSIPKS